MCRLFGRTIAIVLLVTLFSGPPGPAAAAPAAPGASPEGARAERGVFATMCRFSHEAADDPIVFPGQAGKSHLHTFFGNRTTSAVVDVRELAGRCDDLPHGGRRIGLLGASALPERRRGQAALHEGVLPDRTPRAGGGEGVPGRLPGGCWRCHGNQRAGPAHDVLALPGTARSRGAGRLRADRDAPELSGREPADASRPVPGVLGRRQPGQSGSQEPHGARPVRSLPWPATRPCCRA